MHLHQILTGSCNNGDECLSYGSIKENHFIAYGSGRDIIILNSEFVRSNIISGQKFQLNDVTALSCSYNMGNIAVVNNRNIFIFSPQLPDDMVVDLELIKWDLCDSFDTTDNSINSLTWIPYNNDMLVLGGSTVQIWKKLSTFHIGSVEGKSSWTCLCNYEMPNCQNVKTIEFSLDGRYFASYSYNSYKLLIWFCNSSKDFNNIKTMDEFDGMDYIVLNHPKNIISFKWRENNRFVPNFFMKNMILTCCEDNICRIWSEAHCYSEEVRYYTSAHSQSYFFDENSPQIEEMLYKLDTSNLKYKYFDGPRKSAVTFRYPRFMLRTTIDNSVDIPLYSNLYEGKYKGVRQPLVVHWLNNKTHNFSKVLLQLDNYYKRVYSEENRLDVTSFSRVYLKELRKMKKTSDVVFAFIPMKGSLIVWQVHNLDETFDIYSEEIENCQYFKNSYVIVHSCLPNNIPIADASSMKAKIILFSTQKDVYSNLLSRNMRNLELNMSNIEITMVSKQENGSLNLWNISVLNDSTGNSSILSTNHLSRISGHRWQTHTAACHTQLPLLLTFSNFTGIKTESVSDMSELILWKVKGMGPYSKIGGISEIARINSKFDQYFYKITWFPGIVPSTVFDFTISSPSSLFVACDIKNSISLYLSIPEANELLSQNLLNSFSQPSGEKECYRIISLSSTGEPGCIVLMGDLDESNTGESEHIKTLYLHVYPSSMFVAASECYIHPEQNKVPNDCDAKQFQEVYYVIRVLENSNNESVSNLVEIWRIKLFEIPKVKSKNSVEDIINIRFESQKVFSECICPNVKIVEAVPTASHSSSACIHPECIAPYLMATLCSDNTIRFWKCQTNDLDKELKWTEWINQSSGSQITTQIKPTDTTGQRLSCAYSGRVALLGASVKGKVNVSIYECESTGGSEWILEDELYLSEYVSDIDLCNKKLHINWINSEDGFHLLLVGVDTTIWIFSPTCIDKTKSGVRNDIRIGRWIKIKEINLNTPSSSYVSIEHVSWAREGLMIVGIDNEIHVYNQWNTDASRQNRSESENQTHEKLKSNYSYARLEEAFSKITEKCEKFSIIKNSGLFEVMQIHNPILPQYHPTLLLEWIKFGKIRRVKAILLHLTNCICGRKEDCMEYNEIKMQNKQSQRLEIKAIPPLPLHMLLDIDRDSVSKNQRETPIKSNNDFTDFADDFTGTSMSISKEISWKNSLENDDAVFDEEKEMGHYSSERANALSDKLLRVQLPGITTLDQIYLLGISEIMCSIKNDTLNTKESDDTKMNPANSLDDCGLRFYLAMQHYNHLCNTLPITQRNLVLNEGLDMSSIVWGFHSETEGELCKMLNDITHNNLMWIDFKRFGCGWWIRSDTLLQTTIEKVAKNTFQNTKDPMDVAIFYLAMGKQNLLSKLFKNVNKASLSDFFGLNFGNDENKNRALNQAFNMRSKRRYEHAIALFLLSSCIDDAILICIHNLKDIQLAITIVRLYNLNVIKGKISYPELLKEQILNNDDPFVRSIGYWMIENYLNSLSTLLEDKNMHNSNSERIVFIFYNYLKNHPLINRCKINNNNNKGRQGINGDAGILGLERRLYFGTAYKYFKMGCPDLALEVLSSLPEYIVLENVSNTEKKIESVVSAKPTKEVMDGIINWDDFDEPIQSECKISFSDSDDDAENEKNEFDVFEKEEQLLNNEPIHKVCDIDIISLRFKFIICIKLISEEMCTLASGIETTGSCLRAHIYDWLQKEVKVLHEICFPNSTSYDTDNYANCLAKLDSEVNRSWLNTNQHLILSLYSFCSSLSTNNIGLGAIRIELLILLQKLQGTYSHVIESFKNMPDDLKIPFLICSLSPETGLVSNPILQIQNSLSDITSIINYFKCPEMFLSINTNYTECTKEITEDAEKAHYVLHLCENLSAIIFQCLSVLKSSTDVRRNRRKRQSSVSVLYTPEADIQHRCKYSNDPTVIDLFPNSDPNKWPGFTAFISAFGLKGKCINTKYAYLLTENLVVIYVGMLIHAFKTNNANIIYRLVNVNFNKELWGKLFGGTLRKKPQRPDPPGSSSPKITREGGNAMKIILPESKSPSMPPLKPQPPSLDERFIPSTHSILNTLLEKPTIPQNEDYNYNSDNDNDLVDDDDDIDDDNYSFDVSSVKEDFKSECTDIFSYTWCLLKLVTLKAINNNITNMLNLIKIEPSEIACQCPHIFSMIKIISQWEFILKTHLFSFKFVPDPYKELIDVCDLEMNNLKKNATNLEKLTVVCKTLKEVSFGDNRASVLSVERLWKNLLSKAEFQPIFMQHFIHLKDIYNYANEDQVENSQNVKNDTRDSSSIKIVHKEHETLYSIAINKSDPSYLVTATAKDIIEINVENLTNPKKWMDDDYQFLDDLFKESPIRNDKSFSTDFLLVTPTFGSHVGFLDSASMVTGSRMVLKRPVSGAHILKSHPRLPYYLSGNSSGQVSVFEWGVENPVVKTYAPIQKGKITSLNFDVNGTKFGMGDSESILSLCHFSYADNSKSQYFHTKCPHKGVLDLCFLNSSSLIATCGGSGISGISPVNHLHAVSGGISTFDNSSPNIVVWDILMPHGRNQIKSFADSHIAIGVTCLQYLSKNEQIIFGTRKGDVGFIELRKNCIGKVVQAHNSPITSIKLDSLQQFFITSSADGYMKIFSLDNCDVLEQYKNESTKTSVFRQNDIGIKCFELLDDDKIVSCGNDGLIRLRYLNSITNRKLFSTIQK